MHARCDGLRLGLFWCGHSNYSQYFTTSANVQHFRNHYSSSGRERGDRDAQRSHYCHKNG